MKMKMKICALLISVCVGLVQSQSCQMTELQKCTEPLRKFSDARDLTDYSDYAEDEEHRHTPSHDEPCVLLRNSLKCIDSFTERCLPPKQKYAVDMLFEEVRHLVHHKCPEAEEMEHRMEHQEHIRCMSLYHTEYQECVGLYKNHTSELRALEQHYSDGDHHDHHHHHIDTSKIITSVCCGFLKYVDCSVNLFQNKCGERVGVFAKKYLTETAGSIISARCSSYRHDSPECMLTPAEVISEAEKHSNGPYSAAPNVLSSCVLTLVTFFVTIMVKN